MKEFIDEFKHLEKICNEIYGEHHGVTFYINDMEEKPRYSTRVVESWDRDLENLKRVRHIRNNLVHESDYDIDYDESDIKFLREFHDRILNRQDPLALLREKKRLKERELAERIVYEKSLSQYSQGYSEYPSNRESHNTSYRGWIRIGLIIIIVMGIFCFALISILILSIF